MTNTNSITIISDKQLQSELPLDQNTAQQIASNRQIIADIIQWKDPRKLLIVWPCSMDYRSSLLEYAKQLKEIIAQVQDQVFIVMRTYSAKPRTTIWWKWMLYNWEHNSWWNINDWLRTAREIMLEINKLWIPIADEMLYPDLLPYTLDLLSYIAIWARSSENQQHREIASCLDLPVWIKNPISWDIPTTINSLIAARSPQQVRIWDEFFQSSWNPDSHIILRWQNNDWISQANIGEQSLEKTTSLLKSKWLSSSILIDLNHDNSWKDPQKQIDNLRHILWSDYLSYISWFMIESYLEWWNQNPEIENPTKWLSLTDPCLSIQETKELILELAETLRTQKQVPALKVW